MVGVPDPVLDLDVLAPVANVQGNRDSPQIGGAPDDPPTGANALPIPSFVGNRSFARVARSDAHPSKGVHPLPCAKTSPIVENINFYNAMLWSADLLGFGFLF